MELPMEMLIVSDSPIFARAVQQLLDQWPGVCRSRVRGGTETAAERGRSSPDGLLLAPRTWEELAYWLPTLRREYRACPWLLLTEPRLAGMFLSALQAHSCTLVAPDASLESLQDALRALAARRGACLSAELQARFARGAGMEAALRWARSPSLMELQCACAVSLGLSNRRIAEVLHMGEATVKSHVHHLLQKLGLSGRSELGALVQRALAPLPARIVGEKAA
jgi:DNA-binding NarL/FixJ family response regulator